MSGVLLRTGRLREYNALGAVGRPVYTAAPQLRATVKRMLGAERADLLALPQINEAGDTIDWYAPFGGLVVPWSAASEEERAPARQILQQARQDFHGRSTALLSQGSATEDAEVFGRMLPLALHIPDESHIHLVNGRPVVTFWGFTRLNAPQENDVVRDLAPHPAAPAPPLPPVIAPVLMPRPWWRRWWWWLLLLLPFLLLLLFGLRGCGVNVPLPGLSGPLPDVTLPSGQVPQVTVPGVAVPGVAVPGVTVPGGLAMVVPGAVVPGVPPPDATNPNQQSATPPHSDAPVPPGVKGAEDKGLDVKGSDGKTPDGTTPPAPPPLALPDTALKDGSTGFLNGHWRSRTGLMDSQTGRPLEVEYDFKDGKGTATIMRSDGTKCPAPVEAAITGGKLVLDQTADARCADGQVFDRSRVECRQGKNGKAECQGVNADGGGYSVQIVK